MGVVQPFSRVLMPWVAISQEWKFEKHYVGVAALIRWIFAFSTNNVYANT